MQSTETAGIAGSRMVGACKVACDELNVGTREAHRICVNAVAGQKEPSA